MRRPYSRLAAVCALAVVTSVCAGAALAGNPNAPGQQKKDDAAAQPAPQAPVQQTAPEQQAAPQQQAAPAQSSNQVPPGQAKKESSQSTPSTSSTAHESPGKAKKASAQSSASVQASSSTQAGVKPSSTTSHWTHCTTGGTASAATCTATQGTPNAGSDVSKRYGNGKTAAQIAVGRGAPAGTLITGPGNSQPHKVSDCRHKSNPSGGVDVHAIKHYGTSCTDRPQQQASVSTVAPCGFSVVVATTLKPHGATVETDA